MNNIFIVFIFLDWVSVDWTRFGARERYQPSCRHTHTQSFLMPIESTRFQAHPGDRIWTPPRCKPPLLWRPCRLHTYIRPLTSAPIRCWAMMGYSRVGSQSLLRALRTWTLEGFADAGSTGLPLLGLLRNRGVRCFSRDE